MRGIPYLRAAMLGLALTGLTVSAQTPTTTPQTKPATPTQTTPATTPPTTQTQTPAVSPTAVAVTVNGHPIYETVVVRALERVPPARRNEVRPNLVDHLVNNLLIDQSLKAAGYKVEATEIEKRVTEMKAELKKVGRDFDKMLKELKVAESELREHIEADLRWFKYASAQATDKVLSDLFTANKDMFDGTTVRAQHILMTPKDKTPQTAQKIVADLRAVKTAIENEVNAALAKLPGSTDNLARETARQKLLSETFDKHAREKSDCPSKANGGAVGPFPKAGFMVAAFSNAAFAMKPYELSDAVATPFGYHLILVTEKKAGKEVKFEEVKEVVKEVYLDRLHESLAGQLRQKASIVYPKQ